ncbi:MAG: type IV toxin-antitoxin system AbiEi family antitoxin domain-containing protein, partial [Actinobacteria bacterium]|nr:type IV toxin-antitoxin system AbiEi family antitoxin domain-containing protein [Actinomycetota bacterium]
MRSVGLLHQLGWSDSALTRAVRSGRLHRVRRGQLGRRPSACAGGGTTPAIDRRRRVVEWAG